MSKFAGLPTAPCARAFSLQTVSSGPHCRAVPSMVQIGALAQRRVCARYKPMSAEDLQSSLENIDVDPKVKDNIVQAVLVKQQSQQVAKQQELDERQQQLVSNRLTDPVVLLLQQQHDYTMDAISQVRKQQDSLGTDVKELGKEARELDNKLSLKVDESTNKLSVKMDESISRLGTEVKELGKEARELDSKLSLKIDESINKLSLKMDESISRLGTEVKELGKEVKESNNKLSLKVDELKSNQSQLRTLFYVLLAFLGPMVFKDLFPLISKLLT